MITRWRFEIRFQQLQLQSPSKLRFGLKLQDSADAFFRHLKETLLLITTKAVLNTQTMKWIPIESYHYEGPVDACCGPSAEMTAGAAQQTSFSKTLQTNYATQFEKQSAILDQVNSALSPIVSAGSSQHGFSAQELASRNTQAINSSGGNYANAQRALSGRLSGRGGDAGILSGVDAQLQSGLLSDAAGKLSDEQLAITNADYGTGRQNFWNATAGQKALAGLYDPTGYAHEGTSAGAEAFNENSRVQQMRNEREKAIAGMVTTLGTDALTFGAGAATNAGPAGLSRMQSGMFALGGGGLG